MLCLKKQSEQFKNGKKNTKPFETFPQPRIEIVKLLLQRFIEHSLENFNHCGYDPPHDFSH